MTGEALAPGDSIGRYRIESLLGSGGMGVVYAAVDRRLGRRVALKVISAHDAASPGFRARFDREAAVLARLDSPHVVSIYDHGEHDGQPYLAMQLAAGGDLGTLLRQRGAMPPTLAVRACGQVADALVAAHAVGVVHRDVKPANVLLRDDRVDRLHVYLSDFGVALTETSGLTTPGAIAGTWNHLAPERAAGEPGTPASDVYSVGCLLHELLTGRPPFQGTDVDVAMQHLSAPVPQLPGSDDLTLRVNHVLGRSLAKDPADRHASAAELRDELRLVEGSLTGATPLPGLPPVRRRRRRGAAVLAAVSVLAVVGGGTAVAVIGGGEDEPDPSTPTSAAPSPDVVTTDAPSPDPTSEPEPEPVVTGDLDDDGLGDLVVGEYEDVRRYDSTGRGFADSRPVRVDALALVRGRFGPGGAAGFVGASGLSEPEVTLTVYGPGGQERGTTALKVPRVTGELDPDLVAGDVDGDGLDDVVLVLPRGPQLAVRVTLGRGDGTFGPARPWFEGRLADEEADVTIGDLDGDGRADLVWTRFYESLAERPGQIRLLRSTGRSFEETGDPVPVPDEFGGSSLGLDESDAGDLDGDGVDELVYLRAYGMDAVVWRWSTDDGAFEAPVTWAVSDFDSPGGDGIAATLIDVDGDGRDDVVTVGTDDLKVHLSNGTSFTFERRWTRPVEYGDPVGDVDLGIY